MKNRYSLNNKVVTSSKIGKIVPLDFLYMIPNTDITIDPAYYVNVEACNKQIYADMSYNVVTCFVPLHQIFANWKTFYMGGGDPTAPYRTFDTSTNTNNTKLSYYLLPQGTGTFDITMLPHRAYQKIIFDLFLSQYFRNYTEADIPVSSWYSTGDGADSTTSDTCAYAPMSQDYIVDCVADLFFGGDSGTVSVVGNAFTISDVKAAIMTNNFNRVRQHFGVRMQDFMDKIFGVERKSKDLVELVNIYRQKLNITDVINTDSSQGAMVSKVYGSFPSSKFNYKSEDFGVLMSVAFINLDDMYYSNGIDPNVDYDLWETYEQFFHPELQGLGGEGIRKRNINISFTDAALASTELYNKYRKNMNRARGDYAREARKGQHIPYFRGDCSLSTIADTYYAQDKFFAHFFADTSSDHATFYARNNIISNAPISKVLTADKLLKEFSEVQIL